MTKAHYTSFNDQLDFSKVFPTDVGNTARSVRYPQVGFGQVGFDKILEA